MHSRIRHRYFDKRTGFTLLESMLAASLLFMTVVAVLTAITAGQQNAYESHVRVAGTLAAEELMGQISSESYSNLGSWNNFRQNVGAMEDADENPLPKMYDMIGRSVAVSSVLQTLPNGVKIQGRQVIVQAFDRDSRVVATVQQFVPEPKS